MCVYASVSRSYRWNKSQHSSTISSWRADEPHAEAVAEAQAEAEGIGTDERHRK